MRKILVTGGAGFVGSALVDKLIENPDNFVVTVDDLTTGEVGKFPKAADNFQFIKCDVNEYNDIAEIMLSFKFDFVFHYAAVVGVKRTQKHPVKVLRDIEGIKHILGLAKNTGVKRVFFSSSSEIYGEPVEIPQNVYTTPLNSRLPYAIVKNVGEAFLRSYYKEYGLEYTIFRFFNTYGPKQSADFVISKFMVNAMRDEDITIYGDGEQTRTFCYVDDNVDTTIKAFYENKVVNDVINIGGSREITINELAKTIIELTGSKSKLQYLPPLEEGDMKRRRPDNTEMKSILNRDLITLRDGLKKILDEGLYEIN